MPQPIRDSRENSAGMPRAAASPEAAFIMASGPQAKRNAGLRRPISSSASAVTKPVKAERAVVGGAKEGEARPFELRPERDVGGCPSAVKDDGIGAEGFQLFGQEVNGSDAASAADAEDPLPFEPGIQRESLAQRADEIERYRLLRARRGSPSLCPRSGRRCRGGRPSRAWMLIGRRRRGAVSPETLIIRNWPGRASRATAGVSICRTGDSFPSARRRRFALRGPWSSLIR